MAKEPFKDPFENLPRRSMFVAGEETPPKAQEKLKRIAGARAAIETKEPTKKQTAPKKRKPAKKRKAKK
ncbi:hypothetical protein [Methylosinus sporium]